MSSNWLYFYKFVVQEEVLFKDIILKVVSVQNICEVVQLDKSLEEKKRERRKSADQILSYYEI